MNKVDTPLLLRVLLVVVTACLLPALGAQEKALSDQGVIAIAAGVPITEGQLYAAIAEELEKLELQRLQAEANYARGRYQIRERGLNRLVEERLIDARAAKEGISRIELLAREVDGKIKDPTEQEINAFFEANKARITQPREQVLPQIRQYLLQQNQGKVRSELVERLKSEYGAVVKLEPYRVPVESAGHPARGPAESRIVLVEFSDFECDFCRSFAGTLDQLIKNYDGKVRLVFRQFPLTSIHPLAQKAAEASLCASDQGRFWEMHDLLFKDAGKLKVDDLKAKAASLGLDAAAFNSCLDSGKHVGRLRADVREGTRAGVAGTPALFVNGRLLSGVRPYDEIAKVIDEELRALSGPAPAKR